MYDTHLNISGVLPHLSVGCSAADRPRSESGIGALLPWADRLWFVTYVSHTGKGTGLFSVDKNLFIKKHAKSCAGTYANRMIHPQSDSILIGPHIIDARGDVTTIPELAKHRLAAVAEHLTDPDNKVYYLTMEGLFLEMDLHSLKLKQLFDLAKELAVTDVGQIDYEENPALVPQGRGMETTPQPHFKAAHTGAGRVVVANNTFGQMDFIGHHRGGRLAEWDGNQWTILEDRPFSEVAGRRNWEELIFATGWDRASAILKVLVNEQWQTYRMPKGSHNFEHFWQTEWPRIREVESERYIMDASGIFYELSPVSFAGKIWGIKPIACHMRITPDFCAYKGMLVLAGNQTTPIFDTNLVTGYPEANLWLGKTDDLWRWGKPCGWGGPWWKQRVRADTPSDPYLMTGFDKKVLHLSHDAKTAVDFKLEADFLGDGSWHTYDAFSVPPGKYIFHTFPDGYSAHWVRLTPSRGCIATAYFTYT